MKKAVMTGLAALCGTFAVCGQYLKRWFPVREICVVHSIIVLTIPALFIGCGAPVGALFDDTSTKTHLPPEVVEIPVEIPVEILVEDPQHTILQGVIQIRYDYPDLADPYNSGVRQSGISHWNYYELNELLIRYSGYTFSFGDGVMILCEGSLTGLGNFLLTNWEDLAAPDRGGGRQNYMLDIFPPPRKLIITGTNFWGAVTVSLSDTAAGGGTTVAVGAGFLTGELQYVPGTATIPLQNNDPNNYLANWTGDNGEYFIKFWNKTTPTGGPPSDVTSQKIRFSSTETTTVVGWSQFHPFP
jgi:hypothetical protein